MKRFISIIFAVALAMGSAIANDGLVATPASTSKVIFTGRTQTDGESVSFDWSGVYMRIRFEGRYFAMSVSDTQKNYFNVWLDKDSSETPDKVIATFGSDSLIVVFDETELKGKAPHDVLIQRRTEGNLGITTIHKFYTQKPLLQADAPKDRLIEFIGDSYTCGYGTENSIFSDPFKPETENCNYAYGPIIARYFDADYILVSHSGKGIVRNYADGEGPCMPELYLRTFDLQESPAWKADGKKPDLTVIYLGTNDFSEGKQPGMSEWNGAYAKLLNEVKANYGENHPILCIASFADEFTLDYVRNAVMSSGLGNVYYMALTNGICNGDDDLGASWHPNYKGQKKKAYAIIPYISTITGWALKDGDVR